MRASHCSLRPGFQIILTQPRPLRKGRAFNTNRMLYKYKLFEFTAYEVYDLLHYRDLGIIFQTIADAERGIKEDDNKLREEWRSSSWPFRHHKYRICKMLYTATLRSVSDDFIPSFSILCNAVTRRTELPGSVMYRIKD